MKHLDLDDYTFPEWEGHRTPNGPWEPCFLCERPVRTDRSHWAVVWDMDACAPVAPETPEDEAALATADICCYAIGPACRKKLPAEFLFKNSP
jgi:hypothetical protein